ncbi:hypothetical protein BKA70DRAFT_1236574 [Coprinopsis sp. MPI-PUGE-AT-0042]|nr:hypothetical protein BKA70DRAFT_1236574 [Coprinopsis sp. MPI-PUGE-AT-0042]
MSIWRLSIEGGETHGISSHGISNWVDPGKPLERGPITRLARVYPWVTEVPSSSLIFTTATIPVQRFKQCCAYMHGFGYLDAMGIKHDIDSAHIVHLSAEIVRKLALAIKNGDSSQGRLPCVTYFGHGAVLHLVEYFIHSVAQLDGGFIGRHRPSPLQLMNLPVALLSAVMYTACRRVMLNLTASDVLDDIEAQSLILNKTEAMHFVLQNPSRFLSQIDHKRLVNKFVKAYTDICSPFPKDVAADYGFVPLPDVPPEDQEPCGGAKEITYAEQVARAIDDRLCQPGGNTEIGA